MSRVGKRIGILGGTFDPPHLGHLAIAMRAMKQLRLDELWFLPARIPPHKQGKNYVAAHHRTAMTRRAIHGHDRFRLKDDEIRRHGVSYTVNTLERLRQLHPRWDFFLVVGEDNYRTIGSWRDLDRILELATIAVYARSRRRLIFRAGIPARVLRGKVLPVSSSQIREWIRRGKDIAHLVPRAVSAYINKHRLYISHRSRRGERPSV